MIDDELLNNYKKSLSQKYHAVCLDIDGTLTETNSIKIDERVLPVLASLLKKRIPVVFITGRGETGLLQLKRDIIIKLQQDFGITYKQFRGMYALTNDGARLFSTKKSDYEIFDNSQYTTSPTKLHSLKMLDNKLIEELKSKGLLDYCKITYSRDLRTDTILNIRIAPQDNQEKKSKIIATIQHLLSLPESNNINLTVGMYHGNQIFQIGTTVKSNAIKTVEKIIGIPENSMLRLGDCGNEEGNDYTMLNCSQGFSVDKTSSSKDKCFPVINENGEILSGVDATIFLLNKAKLLPTICLEHATESDYTKSYSKIEKEMILGRNKRISVFNDIVNTKFNVNDGIYDLYDKFSGSMKIPLYEWINIDDDNPLKIFWSKQYSSHLAYAMHDNESILLRGPQVYYYFLSHRVHDILSETDIISKNMILEWLNNCEQFYTDALKTIADTKNTNDLNNTKMILGILDNYRNQLIILLNQQIGITQNNKSLLINLEKVDKESIIYQLYSDLIMVHKMMQNLTFDTDFKIDRDKIGKLLQHAILITNQFTLSFQDLDDRKNYCKEFRVYREIDNFAENFITCYLSLPHNIKFNNLGVCGLCYGGIELPIIMKSLYGSLDEVSILKFNQDVTGYTKKQSMDLRFFDIFRIGGIETQGIDNQKNYVLCDDNLLTGKTMQIALTTLYDLGINVDKAIVVRYPSVNRISQMFLPNHGAVDYRCFFDFIQGLYFPSPYSWRDPYSSDKYEDSLGVFDLNRRKILECLLKNGDYAKNSEVQYIKCKKDGINENN